MFYFIIEENRALFTSLHFRFTFSVIDHLHEKPKTSLTQIYDSLNLSAQ